MEVDKNDDFMVARLKNGVFDVIKENFDLLASNWRVEETIIVRLESTGCSFLCGARSHVEVF